MAASSSPGARPAVESFRNLADGSEFDFVIIGSGFGGSVAALRLSEKGYAVAVLEAGRHYEDEDFARTNWNLRRYLWLPKLFCYGIQRLTLLKDLLVVSGAGVGGGSLVYANTLLEPGRGFYASPEASRIAADLRERLAPHFAAARRMLGVSRVARLFPADEVLREIAGELGRADTFAPVEAGVFFGEPGKTVADPYFGGEGPARAGCIYCGGCMVGCRHNAKNTLMKNYLHLALKKGARIFSMTTARGVRELAGGGFAVAVRRSGWGLRRKEIRARRLIVSAGVLGTLRLLMSCALPRLSPRLGRDVRTNSEVLSGSSARDAGTDYSEGLAITAGMWPDEKTHVEAVRYPQGSDAMNLLGVRLKAGFKPRDILRGLWPFGWARRSTILLFMQTVDSRLRVLMGRCGRLKTQLEEGSAPLPREIPVASRVLERFTQKTDGIAQVSLATAALGVSTTAHILGGAVIGRDTSEGVVGLDGRAFGYEDLWILDGSIIPGNLGVNPSLTITALAEHAMSLVPAARAKGSSGA
ncbi:MAG: GMC family oxidoreductase [Elusimicrobia bacterium]|nr:GMC family oxidoreductase [Elusimicrobiota bacterium]